jgi:hypothetical protein
MRRFVVTLAAVAMLSAPMAVAPSAAQAQVQDGLVNVVIGDVTILEDVNVAVAANVVAQICGLQVQQVQVLATSVDATGTQRTVCTTRGRRGQEVIITQN